MCGNPIKAVSSLFGGGSDTSTPTVTTPSPTPTAVDNGDDTSGTTDAASKAKKKRGFSSTRTAVNTALSSSDTTGKKTLG